jgi:tight adherence protein B
VAGFALIEGLAHTYNYFRARRADELKRRLDMLGSDTRTGGMTLLRQGKLSSAPIVDAFLRGVPLAVRIEALLEQAEMRISVARLLTISGSAAGAGLLLGLLASGSALLMSPLLGMFGAGAPFLFVLWARARRSRKISEQLPEALEMMARSLRAGHALPSAFKLVATEMATPVSTEFGRAFEEQNLGMPFERAVAQMTRRCPGNRDLKIFAVSVIVQKETGGNLVEIIEKLAETVRSRYRFFGKLRSLTAEGRMSSYVLAALPVGTGIFIGLANPEYTRLLITDRIGQMALGYAVVSWAVGLFWMWRMTKVPL